MAYGARLESVLGESPRGFESPILRERIAFRSDREHPGEGDFWCPLGTTSQETTCPVLAPLSLVGAPLGAKGVSGRFSSDECERKLSHCALRFVSREDRK